MRRSCDSSMYWWSSWASAFADARSCPKGFSTTTRACSVSPAPARPLTTLPNRNGGIPKITNTSQLDWSLIALHSLRRSLRAVEQMLADAYGVRDRGQGRVHGTDAGEEARV